MLIPDFHQLLSRTTLSVTRALGFLQGLQATAALSMYQSGQHWPMVSKILMATAVIHDLNTGDTGYTIE